MVNTIATLKHLENIKKDIDNKILKTNIDDPELGLLLEQKRVLNHASKIVKEKGNE